MRVVSSGSVATRAQLTTAATERTDCRRARLILQAMSRARGHAGTRAGSGPVSRKWPRRFFLRGSGQPLPYSIGQPYPMQEIDESRVVAQRIEPWINVEIRHPT